jgi:putative DNA primase/helicase
MCGRWFRYLTECFRDDDDAEPKIDLLQEFLGACLVGVTPRFQKALMCIGDGDNGKSVFASISMALFPPSMRQAIKPQDFGSEYYRARLAAARINIVAETPEAEILSSDSFKAIISGDGIMGRDPAGRPFLFNPGAGHVFVANRLPSTSDHTHGFWKRFYVVQWNRIFKPEEMDRGLTDYLIRNEMPAIAAWAVRGAERLLNRGAFTVPPSADRALAQWKAEVDPVAAFLKSCTKATPGGPGVQSSILYAVFKDWLGNNGHRLMSITSFGRRMRAHGFPPDERADANYYFVALTVPVPVSYFLS